MSSSQTLSLGKSVGGRLLQASLLGRASQTVLVLGAFHGDEPQSAHVAGRLGAHLRDHPESMPDRQVIVFTPVNPDGLAAGTRTNANGVDLNRNYKTLDWHEGSESGLYCRGSTPGSEPETIAVMALVRRYKPSMIISIHCIDAGKQCINHNGPARQIADSMARHNGYPVTDVMDHPTPGSFGTWAGDELGIPTITLEMPSDLHAEECWSTNQQALLEALRP